MIPLFTLKRQILALLIPFISLCSAIPQAYGQQKDSIMVIPVSRYDSVSRFHRKIFGENYRKEYATATAVPVIRLSQVAGGLKATQLGGGHQSHSLRLADKNGREWALRSVQKYPGILLPLPMRQTFMLNLIDDNMSSQHPFSALVIPKLADAAGIPHSNPIIGWISPDHGLGDFAKDFENTLCLLEEHEPMGKSDNTAKMLKQLTKDHEFHVDWKVYLKAKALDVLTGDWDRHEDQWRWKIESNPDGNHYIAVPRDRDQVFFRSEGLIQRVAQSSWMLPMMQGYERDVQDINWFLWEGRHVNSRVFAGVSSEQWDSTINEFCALMTDSLLGQALSELSGFTTSARKQQLYSQMKGRRDALPGLMKQYFRFLNKVVDIELSDKAEQIRITNTSAQGLNILVTKTTGLTDQQHPLLLKDFYPSVTKEIRIFLHAGKDSVVMDSLRSKIKLRIVSGLDEKKLDFSIDHNSTKFYGKADDIILGTLHRGLSTKISADTGNIGYMASDPYKRSYKLLNASYNGDDGLMLGLTSRFTFPGFRRYPYGNSHIISFLYAFRTSAFSFSYKGEWIRAVKNGDFIIDFRALVPHNTRNFFGLGNETRFDKNLQPVEFYRARYAYLDIKPAVRYHWDKTFFSVGPAFSYYNYDETKNAHRFIDNFRQPGPIEIANIDKSKFHAGIRMEVLVDTRDNEILPKSGIFFKTGIDALKGLNRYSNSMGSMTTRFAFFIKIDSKGNLTLVDRIGAGLSIGKPEFYQGQSLGGQDNLTGFRQFRYAGDHNAFNNLELRLKLGNVMSYILPGEIGIVGVYDIGRVWVKGDRSSTWHQGGGPGIYFAPASYFYLNAVAGYSREGWYPTVALKSRF